MSNNDSDKKDTPLIKAVRNNDKGEVDRLLESGADVNAKDGGGSTALIWAARADAPGKVKILSTHELEAIRKLLNEYNAGAFIENILLRHRGGNAKEDKKTIEKLIKAVQCNLYIVELLLAQPHIQVDATDKNGETALMEAAKRGKLAIVANLVEKNANVNAQDKVDGYTPLMSAFQNDQLGVAVFLLLLGRDVDVNKKDKKNEETVLMHVVRYKKPVSDLDLLIKNNAKRKETNKNGETALMLAAIVGNYDAAKYLLSYYTPKELKEEKNKDGKTALDLAIENGHLEVADFLREHGAKRGCDL